MDDDLLENIASAVARSYLRSFDADCLPGGKHDLVGQLAQELTATSENAELVHTVVRLLTWRDNPNEIDGCLAAPLYYFFGRDEHPGADIICAVKGKMRPQDRHVILLSPQRGFRETILAAHACMGISIVRSLGMVGLMQSDVIADMAGRGLALSRRVMQGAASGMPSVAGWSFKPVSHHHWHGMRDRSTYSLALSIN